MLDSDVAHPQIFSQFGPRSSLILEFFPSEGIRKSERGDCSMGPHLGSLHRNGFFSLEDTFFVLLQLEPGTTLDAIAR